MKGWGQTAQAIFWEIAQSMSKEEFLDLEKIESMKKELSGVDLSGKDLSNANLVGANLEGANLSEANLTDTDLREANLKSADLTGANLQNTYLRHANLRGANLNFAANISSIDIQSASIDRDTKFPAYIKIVWTSKVNFECKNIFKRDKKGRRKTRDLREKNKGRIWGDRRVNNHRRSGVDRREYRAKKEKSAASKKKTNPK